MKNLKIYKSVLALLTSTSILLFSGCTGSKEETKEESKKQSDPCKHLTICFEEGPITFKECEGYDISVRRYNTSSEINYGITKDDTKIISGVTTIYNEYDIYHSIADEQIDAESIQKSKQK